MSYLRKNLHGSEFVVQLFDTKLLNKYRLSTHGCIDLTRHFVCPGNDSCSVHQKRWNAMEEFSTDGEQELKPSSTHLIHIFAMGESVSVCSDHSAKVYYSLTSQSCLSCTSLFIGEYHFQRYDFHC